MSSWGSPLLDPKKLQNQRFYIIDWIRKKLLVDVANLATCCHDDYDVLLEVLGTLGKCYVSNPVAKTLVLDWKSWLAQLFLGVFVTLCGVKLLLDPKKLQNDQFYIIDWIRKKILVDVANLATCYYEVRLNVFGTIYWWKGWWTRAQTNANKAVPDWAYLMLHTRQVSTKMSMSHHVFPTPS